MARKILQCHLARLIQIAHDNYSPVANEKFTFFYCGQFECKTYQLASMGFLLALPATQDLDYSHIK